MAGPDDDMKAYCRYCKLDMYTHHGDLVLNASERKSLDKKCFSMPEILRQSFVWFLLPLIMQSFN